MSRMINFLMLLCLLVVGRDAFAQSNGTVTYVYTDPQGTPLAEADANSNITATFDYTPYGTPALGAAPSGPGYTGQVEDPETNLIYMEARYYDSATGRFLSIDPIPASAAQTYSFNRYVYGNNNPTGNDDPTGKSPEDNTLDNFAEDTNGNKAAAPIHNSGQTSSNTPTHKSTSERLAKGASQEEDVERVHLNQSLRTVTGDPNAPNIRPDVTVVRTNGNIDQIEVRSKGQTIVELQEKLAASRIGLGVPGRDIVVEPDAVTVEPVVEVPLGSGLGVLGVLQIIVHGYADHVEQERRDAKLSPTEREAEKACQGRECI